MTIEYRCGKCGALLDTTNADPLHDEIERLRAALKLAEENWYRRRPNQADLETIRAALGKQGKG